MKDREQDESKRDALPGTTGRISRRRFLEIGSGSGAALAVSAAGLNLKAQSPNPSLAAPSPRREQALQIRQDAAQGLFQESANAAAPTNGDEKRYADCRGSFAKTLPHDAQGNVDPQAYAEFVSILMSGDPGRFEQFPRDPQAQSKLANPLSAYAFEMVGADAQAVPLPPPPAFASAEAAFEMVELYWLALTTDVPYRDYETNSLIQAATSDMNGCSMKSAPLADGKVSSQTAFRGATPGDLAGPYISQFLWMDIPYGIKPVDQRYVLPHTSQAFLTSADDWLACQRGVRPKAKIVFDDLPRYIANNHDLSEWVHQDFNFQASLSAALIIQKWGDDAVSSMNPYKASKTQGGGVTWGREVLGLLSQLTSAAQKACYFHKWLVHRRIRPEAYGGKLDAQVSGRNALDIHSDLVHCDGVARTFSAHGSRLLPMCYPEGSPAHPSYPAGHATNAGAGATIIKAFFNESFPIPKPVQANADGSALEPYSGAPLTLGGELNKLAHNVSLGRDAGGVHYRSDGVQGMHIGEAVAISVLRDYSRTYRERFDGFTLTKFDGQKIKISGGKVQPA